MKETYWGYWIVVLGVFVVIIMLLVQNVTSNNTEVEYALKQISEAAIIDAIDYGYWRAYGELKINKEKFEECFLRRFSDTASSASEYVVTFTSIYEAPPKVSVEVTSKTNTYTIASDSTTFDITSRLDGILEINS